jgi:hypothetical protein
VKTKLKFKRTLYWAYGSNLNKEQMRRRCPGASPVSPRLVSNCELVFRGVADVDFVEEGVAAGGLWRITERDEEALDQYEGVSFNYYEKRYFTYNGQRVLFYKMTDRGIMPPSEFYLNCIVQGYRDFGLNLAFLEEALEHSWTGKKKTKGLKERYLRKGRPALAKMVA